MARSTRLGAFLTIGCLMAGGAIASNLGVQVATYRDEAAAVWSIAPDLLRLDSDPPERASAFVDPYTRFHGLDVVSARMVAGRATGWDPEAIVPTPGTWTAAWLRGGLTVSLNDGPPMATSNGMDGPRMAAAQWLSDRAVILLAVNAASIDTWESSAAGARIAGAAWAEAAEEPFDLSATIALGETLQVGGGYQSRSGDSRGSLASRFLPALTQVLDPLGMMQFEAIDHRDRTRFTAPDRIGINGLWQITPQIAMVLGAQWPHWSLMNDLPAPGVSLWHDTWAASAGMDYRLSDTVRVQAGLRYQTAARSGAAQSIDGAPAGGHVMAGMGFSWEVASAIEAQFGYGHAVAAAAHGGDQAAVMGLKASF